MLKKKLPEMDMKLFEDALEDSQSKQRGEVLVIDPNLRESVCICICTFL